MPQVSAPPAPRAPRPVAGGEIAVRADSAGSTVTSTMVYEVWRAPDAAEGQPQGWIELYAEPDAVPTRLDLVALSILKRSVDAQFESVEVQEVGVGMRDGGVSVAFRQEWSTGLVLGTLLVGLGLVAALTAAVRSRRRATAFQTIARHEIASREAERSRVAREIHDGPLQEIAALARSAADSSEAQHSLREVATELRALAAGLRPPALDRFGLAPALEDLAERHARASPPLSVRVVTGEAGGEPVRLPPETELALYRVAQEALVNAIAHGNAQTAWVFLRHAPDAVELVVRDDGHGLAAGTVTDRARAQTLVASGHFGLAGMSERAHAVGGGLTVAPGPGDLGTEVRLRVPVASL